MSLTEIQLPLKTALNIITGNMQPLYIGLLRIHKISIFETGDHWVE